MWASQLLLPYSLPQSPQRITHILAKGCVVLRSLVFRTSSCRFALLSPAFIGLLCGSVCGSMAESQRRSVGIQARSGPCFAAIARLQVAEITLVFLSDCRFE